MIREISGINGEWKNYPTDDRTVGYQIRRENQFQALIHTAHQHNFTPDGLKNPRNLHL